MAWGFKYLCVLTALVSGVFPRTHILPRQNGIEYEDPEDLLNRAIEALGGVDNISRIRTVRLLGPRIYRTRSIPETLSVDGSVDNAVVVAGGQNMSYNYEQPFVKQRFDRVATLGTFWFFARPSLERMDFSMAVHGGDKAYAAVVAGIYNTLSPNIPGSDPSGFVDGQLAAYLVTDAHRWNPLLVNTILSNKNFTYRHESVGIGEEMPAVHENSLGLTVVLDPETSLPYLIRSYEDHPLFGPSTYDLRVYDYVSVNGVMFPRHFKTIYNGVKLITDWLVDDVQVNAALPATYFDGPDGPVAESNVPIYDSSMTAEIQERHANYIWAGPYNGTVESLNAEQPWPSMPGVWTLKLPEWYQYRQMVLELENYVVVMDCPPHQSLTVIGWVEKNLKKPVRFVVPTHHHHDHALGLPDYIKAGAKVVIPQMAREYYSTIEDSWIETFTHDEPYIIENDIFRAIFVHMTDTHHAKDHVYTVIMPACLNDSSPVVVFDADHITSDSDISTRNDHTEIWELIQNFENDRVPNDVEIVSTHTIAASMKLNILLKNVGRSYPNFSPLDFKYAASRCGSN